MKHSDFTIGLEFWCGGKQWRCTDVGTRTVIAIRLDRVEFEEIDTHGGPANRTVYTRAAAEAAGYFNGPPYAMAELVFDEYDFEDCSLEPEPC